MSYHTFTCLLIVIAFLRPFLVSADEDAQSSRGPGAVQEVRLSPELKQALIEEMRAIQHGMMALVPAIASGDWQTIVETGEKIQNSYLFNQQLSPAQRGEFHQTLPLAFQTLDHEFHQTAAQLSHAAAAHNIEIVNFYFCKLSEACVSCHAKFASHRFPALRKADEHGEAHTTRHLPHPSPHDR